MLKSMVSEVPDCPSWPKHFSDFHTKMSENILISTTSPKPWKNATLGILGGFLLGGTILCSLRFHTHLPDYVESGHSAIPIIQFVAGLLILTMLRRFFESRQLADVFHEVWHSLQEPKGDFWFIDKVVQTFHWYVVLQVILCNATYFLWIVVGPVMFSTPNIVWNNPVILFIEAVLEFLRY